MPPRATAQSPAATLSSAEDAADPAELSYETITSLLGQPQAPATSLPKPDAKTTSRRPAAAGSESPMGYGSESSGDLDLDLPDVPSTPPVARKAAAGQDGAMAAAGAAAGRKHAASDEKLDKQLQQLLAEAEGPNTGGPMVQGPST